VPYDKIAGIKNITVYIGSTRKSLYITLCITILYILYSLYLKMNIIALIGMCIAMLILFLLKTKTYEKSHTTSYKYYIWVTYLTGLSTGFAFYMQIV
jgi:4-hydroxybenzoate polyprenyltransferase